MEIDVRITYEVEKVITIEVDDKFKEVSKTLDDYDENWDEFQEQCFDKVYDALPVKFGVYTSVKSIADAENENAIIYEF